MIGAIISSLALSLALTLVLEAGFFLIAGKRNKKDLLLCVLVNIVTNPVVVSAYSLSVMYTSVNPLIALIPLELLAVLFEGFNYKKYGLDFKRPYLFAISANAFSFAIGLLLQLLNII